MNGWRHSWRRPMLTRKPELLAARSYFPMVDCRSPEQFCGKTAPLPCHGWASRQNRRSSVNCGWSTIAALARCSYAPTPGMRSAELDERFYPAYYVDVDLGLALRRLGLVVLFQPRSRIKHHKGASSSKRFRTFVSERNRHLLLEKWGAALDVHEPPQINSSDAIERALAAAEAYAISLRPTRQRALGPTVKRSRFDPELQQRSHIEMSRALRSAYVHHLDELISNHLAVGRAQESR